MTGRWIVSVLVISLLIPGLAGAAPQPTGSASGEAGGAGYATSLPLDRPLISLALEHREKLGLSAQQVKRLRALRVDFRKEAIRRRAELRVQEIELDELLSAGPLDLAAVETKVKQIEALRAQQRLARIRTLEQGRVLLSEEQRGALASLLANGDEERRRRMPGRRMGGMMPGMEMEGMMPEMMEKGMMRGMPGMMKEMGMPDMSAMMRRCPMAGTES